MIARHPSACPLDCPDACTLDVQVEGDRVARIDGSAANPFTREFICAKVRRFADHVHGPGRILTPGIRTGKKGSGEFRPASWDEALAAVAERLSRVRQETGGEAILPFSYGGSNGYLSQDTTDARLFRRLGASRLARTVCAAPSSRAAVGLYGKMPGVALQDYIHSRLIVVWGANPSVSGIHLVPVIQDAQRAGARLVVVDPRRTPLAKKADLHLSLRPGTDLPVALSLIRWFFVEGAADTAFLAERATGAEKLRERAEQWTFERASEVSGIPVDRLAMFARLYRESSPAVIRSGWGMERNRNGGSAIAAVLALPAVAGKFGVRGGGYTMSNSRAWSLGLKEADGEVVPQTRIVNMNRLGETLLSARPPVRALFVYNANPLATLPDQERVRAGLSREDLFTVVFDPVLTDTARYADVVLPATTFLERTELAASYGSMALRLAKPVIPPVGEARSNHDVFAELARRLGLSRPGEPESGEALIDAILDLAPDSARVRRELERGGIAFPPGGAAPVPFVDHLPRTSDGKIHLFPEELDRESPRGLYVYEPDPGTESFPLALISPATDRTISSTLGELRCEAAPLEIHPADAASRGIGNGDQVRVFNLLGEVRCGARLNADLSPGVVFLPKGLWSHNTANGATANALVPDTLTDLGGGACFNDARVEVAKT